MGANSKIFQLNIAAAALTAPAVALAAWSAPEAAPAAGGAGKITADPAVIAGYLRDRGYKAEVSEGKDGDPLITSGSSGYKWAVLFYGCTDHKACGSVQFHAGFQAKTKPELSTINAFNRDKRFSKAYLDNENDPCIDMDVEMSGGTSEEAFKQALANWDTLFGDFTKHMGY